MLIQAATDERLWDSWLLEHEGRFHLFYQGHRADGRGRIGHAVSDDLLSWQRRPDIIPPFWQFTGMVVGDGERFVMGIGDSRDGVQIGRFFESDDLERWRAIPDGRVVPEGPHYLAAPDQWRNTVPWRDPFFFKLPDDPQWHVLLCAARPECGPDDSGATVAHLRTPDFRRWEHLPPLDIPEAGRFYHLEVPEIVAIDDCFYLLFSTGSCYGTRINTPTRRDSVGTYYLVADRIEGPWRLPEDPLLIGAGEGRMGPYVARVIRYGERLILYHHIRSEPDRFQGVWAVPKVLRRDGGGALYPAFFEDLVALTRPVGLDLDPGTDGAWRSDGDGLRGRARGRGSACAIASDQADGLLRCRLTGHDLARAAVVLRSDGDSGVMVALDYELGRVEVTMARRHRLWGWGGDGPGFAGGDPRPGCEILDGCRVSLEQDREYRLTVFVRACYVECYLDDRWLVTTRVDELTARGGVQLCVERGEVHVTDLELRDFEPAGCSTRVGEIEIAGG